MFLNQTRKYNPGLVETAFMLHQKGFIQPNTYVIDLEMLKRNSSLLYKEAKKQNVELFFMTKQLGRNPIIAKAIEETGIDKAVAVSPWEALSLSKAGIKIGHVGHLVQIPKNIIPSILELNPDFVTVFSYDNAKNISDVAKRMKRRQKILLRIANPTDFMYNGQEGGFTKKQLAMDIKKLENLPGIEIAGLTSFPCLLIEDGVPKITPNTFSMVEARNFLLERGYRKLEMNMPSANSTSTLKLIKEHGATQAEPGHAFSGTTPLHAKGILSDNVEKPAIVYVSEVSHIYNKKAFVFGGGFYPRGHIEHALVGTDLSHCKAVPVISNDPSAIDYYAMLNTTEAKVGDTAVFSFRTQIFVTSSQIAVIDNLISGNPKLLGIFDMLGNQMA